MKKLYPALSVVAVALLIFCAWKLHTIAKASAGGYQVETADVQITNLAAEWQAKNYSDAGYTLTAVWSENGVQVKHFEKARIGRPAIPVAAVRPD